MGQKEVTLVILLKPTVGPGDFRTPSGLLSQLKFVAANTRSQTLDLGVMHATTRP